jgi:hypothetical protein
MCRGRDRTPAGGDRPFLVSGADDRLIKVRARVCVCV